MIYIGICDDESNLRHHLLEVCNQIFGQMNLEYQCIEFSSGEEVLAYQGEEMLLLFLDIELGGISGIEVIKKLTKAWRIVFVTCYEQYVWDSFGPKLLSFIRKPVIVDEVEKMLTIAIEEAKNNIMIRFEEENPDTYVKLDDLIYIRAKKKNIEVVTNQKNFTLNGSLKLWESKLKISQLIRSSKECLLNIQWIEQIQKKEIYLLNAEVLPISRKYQKIVFEQYQHFLLEQMRGRI